MAKFIFRCFHKNIMNTNYSVSNKNYASFQGIHIADAGTCVKNINSTLQLFELSSKTDKYFLKNLPRNINMEDLMPNLPKEKYERWHEMLEYASDNALQSDRKTILAVKDGKPCGIIVFLPGKNKFHLDCICTWPIEYGKKVTLAGSTLFKQVFEIFNRSRANKITLEAITNGPYDTVSKYKKLGFRECGGEKHKIFMEASAQKVAESLKRLDELIFDKKVMNSKNENLNYLLA